MTNEELFNQAKEFIPGGVNSPVRSFNAVGGTPFFTTKAQDCFLYDAEGKCYTDYICSWGANIVGHANPYVVEKVTVALGRGFSFGTPTELETELTRYIIKLMPNIQKFRLVSSGTEAVMSAIRLARGYTGKKYIIKFEGCYHGHSDSLLVKAGSGLATFKEVSSNPSSNGVLPDMVANTLVLAYNDINALDRVFELHTNDIAGVIIEPFAGNMNLVRPTVEFITRLRELCDLNKSVLIFDEVMTGFRVAKGGAQELLGIKPDLTILGKVIGGGMPLAGFGGRAEIMDCLSPLGNVYQAGTLSGNPIAVTCGLATLELLDKDGFYADLTNKTKLLTTGLINLANKQGVDFTADYIGGMFGFYFNKKPPQNFAEVQLINKDKFNQFFYAMLNSNVYFAPSMFEAGFICSSHNIGVINETLQHADRTFALMSDNSF